MTEEAVGDEQIRRTIGLKERCGVRPACSMSSRMTQMSLPLVPAKRVLYSTAAILLEVAGFGARFAQAFEKKKKNQDCESPAQPTGVADDLCRAVAEIIVVHECIDQYFKDH